MGGGSALARGRTTVITPLDALRERARRRRRRRARAGLRQPAQHRRSSAVGHPGPGGEPGVDVDWFAGPDLDGRPRAPLALAARADIFGLEPPVPGVGAGAGRSAPARRSPPSVSGTHVFTLVQAGRGRVIVDGATLIDGFAERPPRGTAFFGLGSVEVERRRRAEAGAAGRGRRRVLDRRDRRACAASGRAAARPRPTTCSTGPWPPPRPPTPPSGGRHDRRVGVRGPRPHDDGPARRQDELVRRVLAANPATVVVVNAGVAGDDGLGRRRRAPSLQIWFGGQEMAARPGRRAARRRRARPAGCPPRCRCGSSTTRRTATSRARTATSATARACWSGYRWYEARHLPVRFPFGHGGVVHDVRAGRARARRRRTLTAGDALSSRCR